MLKSSKNFSNIKNAELFLSVKMLRVKKKKSYSKIFLINIKFKRNFYFLEFKRIRK